MPNTTYRAARAFIGIASRRYNKRSMRIALAQINNTVGDLEANAAKILDFARRGEKAGAEVVAFPELALTGYPPRDLVEKQSFLDRTAATLQAVAEETARIE